MTEDSHTYALGHTQKELERLSSQARLIDPITRRFFLAAGIASGMHVLDVGSGAGDVAILVSELVGEGGSVIGVDKAPAALEVARARAEARGFRNVTFRQGDPVDLAFDRPFDAIVGRYVLQFMKDPVLALRSLASRLRPGGVIVFHELDWAGARSHPVVPTYEQCCRWVTKTIELLGADTRMGIKLHSTFVAAGLAAPSLRLESAIGADPGNTECIHLVSDLAATLLPEMERLGVSSASQVGIDTLTQRIHREMAANNGVIVGRAEVAAWTRV